MDTTIKVKRETKRKMQDLITDYETYDTLINRLIIDFDDKKEYTSLNMVRSVKVPKGVLKPAIEQYIKDIHALQKARFICLTLEAQKALDYEIESKARRVIRALNGDEDTDLLEFEFNTILWDSIWAGKPADYLENIPDIMDEKEI